MMRSHSLDRVSESDDIFLNKFHLPLMPIFVSKIPKGASKVCIMTMNKKRATEPRLGKNINDSPFTIASQLPFTSVSLQFHSTMSFSMIGIGSKGFIRSNQVISLSMPNTYQMFAGIATLLQLKQTIICKALILPQSKFKLTLKIKDTKIEPNTALLVASATVSTTSKITLAVSGSSYGGIGK